jgi:hypothetical protein
MALVTLLVVEFSLAFEGLLKHADQVFADIHQL